jgi:hypothetical protein
MTTKQLTRRHHFSLHCIQGVFACALVASTGEAQTQRGARAPILRAHEIALARSAAPSAVSSNARVWVWTGTDYVIADSGKSVVNCYVGRPWVEAVEPHCFDEEGSGTVMPILMRRVQLRAAGKAEAEIERELWEGVGNGRYRLPKRPAVTYMMSTAQKLVNGQGVAVGAWQPHLMIYFPNLSAETTGLPGFVPDLGFVENPGQALSALVVPLRTFVAPDTSTKGKQP